MLERMGRFFKRRPDVPVVPTTPAVEPAVVAPSVIVPPVAESPEVDVTAPVVETAAPAPATPTFSRFRPFGEVALPTTAPTAKESKEIPVDYLVVVADDEEHHAQATKQAAQGALSEGEQANKNNDIRIVKDARELLTMALEGNAGKPADIVLLDDRYSHNEGGKWNPRLALVEEIAQARGIDYSPYTAKVEVEKDWDMKATDTFIGMPGSMNFALTLRTLGYKGKIFVVSSGPPEVDQIMRRVEDIRRTVSDFPDQMPIDGISMKKYLPDVGILYADSVKQSSYNKYGDGT